MSVPMRIALPTDAGNSAKNACVYAASLFRSFDVSYTLINAFSSSEDNDQESSLELQRSQELLEKEAQLLKELVKTESVEVLPVKGDVTELSDSILNKIGISCVVMGTKGKPDRLSSERSRTAQLLRKTHLDFLVVPESWSYNALKRILIVSDLKNNEDAQDISQMNWLLTSDSPEIHIGCATTFREDLSTQQNLNKESLLKEMDVVDEAFHLIKDTHSPIGIMKLANSLQADMVLAFGRQYSFIDELTKESFTQNLSEEMRCPLFVFNPKKSSK